MWKEARKGGIREEGKSGKEGGRSGGHDGGKVSE